MVLTQADLYELLCSAGLREVADNITDAGENVETRLSMAYQYSARSRKLDVFRTGQIRIDGRCVDLHFFDKKPFWMSG